MSERKKGEWDMFDLISSAYYGKGMYFKQDNGTVYSRHSGEYMTVDEAIREFISLIDEETPTAIEELTDTNVGKWIPVTERLPKDGEAVNVVWVNHSPVIYYQYIKDKPQTATGVYYRGQWYWWSAVVQDYLAEYGEWEPDKMDDAIEVTHWMPLPEPPKEAEEGET